MNRVHNFSAGPARLPLPVLQQARQELTNYRGMGRSVMEISHRSDAYQAIHEQAKSRLRRLLGLSDDFHILFLQGGASSQFMMVPFNFLREDETAAYIDTGRWSAKAIKEARLFGNVHVPFSSAESGYDSVPQQQLSYSDDAVYVHYTSNNTVAGSQFAAEPVTGGIPLVCDASSDFLSRPIDADKYGLIYAGAQKNVGPAGVTIVLVRDDFLERAKSSSVPTILQYKTHTGKIFNTPPTFNVYLVNLVLGWLLEKGGIPYFEEFNRNKAAIIYTIIDEDAFYEGAVDRDSRSLMNITFRLPNNNLEQQFLQQAEQQQLVALKGHRSVGGIRASIYNACPMESVRALGRFMEEFRQANS